MALEYPEQQAETKDVGKYKNWQIQRIEKLCKKTNRIFNKTVYLTKSRTQLKIIIHKLNKEALLI